MLILLLLLLSLSSEGANSITSDGTEGELTVKHPSKVGGGGGGVLFTKTYKAILVSL